MITIATEWFILITIEAQVMELRVSVKYNIENELEKTRHGRPGLHDGFNMH